MLSRTASNLFWMGRAIERAEHTARYMKVQYFSSLDTPVSIKKEFSLESILDMSSSEQPYQKKYKTLNDEDVISFVALDISNPASIINCVFSARENARGAVDSISTEVWESINKYYHEVNNTVDSKLRKVGLYKFCNMTEENSSLTNGYINSTMLQDEAWIFINMGIHLERAIQINRIIITTLNDISKLDTVVKNQTEAVINFQWSTLLKSVESFDMYHRYYKNVPNKTNVLEFLLTNQLFPKTIIHNLEELYHYLKLLSFNKQIVIKNSPEFLVGKLLCEFKYLDLEKVLKNPDQFMEDNLVKLYEMSSQIGMYFLDNINRSTIFENKFNQ